MGADESGGPARGAASRAAAPPASSGGRVDLVALLAFALASSRQVQPTHEHRARAQAMLAEHAMRHFSAQVEVLRRDAVLDHLARHGRDRTGALRLAAIGCLATLVAIGLARGAEAMAGQLGWDPAAALAFIGSALARLWPGG